MIQIISLIHVPNALRWCSFHNFLAIFPTLHFMDSEKCRDRKNWMGIIHCRVCNESYQTQINYLSEPIDVYSEWIDECERVNIRADDDNKLYVEDDLRRKSFPKSHTQDDEEDDEGDDPYGQSNTKRKNRYKHVEDDDEEDDEALLNYRP